MWLFAAVSTLSRAGVEQADDAQWLSRAARGEEAAVAALYDRHARRVYSIAFRVVQDEADAEDVVQEVFAQLWRQADRYDPARGPVVAWLLTMARTRAIDRLRARRARPDRVVAWSDDLWTGRAAPLADPSDVLSAERDAERVREALRELPLTQRAAMQGSPL